MTLMEACELAKAIEGNSQFAVIAIGRFVSVDELSSTAKQTLPWSVSVVSLANRSDRIVIHSEADWIAFARELVLRPRQSTASESKPQAAARVVEQQLELF